MFCKYCGKEIRKGVKFCKYCGREIKTDNEVLDLRPSAGKFSQEIPPEEIHLNYAGFWIRLGAFLFDYVLIFILALALGFFLAFFNPFGIELLNISDTTLGFAFIIIYHTFFLSIISSTPGKLVFGLRIIDEIKIEKLTFGKALIRSLSYIISSFFFAIGFLMIAFDRSKHKGLHDRIAKTLVIREKKRNLALLVILSIISAMLTGIVIWYTYSGTEYDFFGDSSMGVIYAELQGALERQPSNFQSLFDEESFIDLKEIPTKEPTEYTKTAKEIFEEYGKAIVTIGSEDLYGDFGFGSGFLISPTGLLVTNYHVIGDADKVVVAVINNGIDLYDVISIIAYDSIEDIAILKIRKEGSYYSPENLPYVVMGNSDSIETGERIFAIGNPEGFNNTISDGIISQIREFEKGIKSFQITAPISMGSSGGALFNEKGEVIGITDSIYTSGQNINFAIPINYVKDLIGLDNYTSESLEKKSEKEKPSEKTIYDDLIPNEDFSDLILCNGEYWQPCPNGQESVCPAYGDPYCCTGIVCNDQCWSPCPSGQTFQCPSVGDAYCEWN